MIPGLCQCGCGEETVILKRTNRQGEPARFLPGHQSRLKTPAYEERDCGHATPCWIWQRGVAGREGSCYGRLKVGGKLIYAHRHYYEQARGPVPEGLELDHLCRVHLCVNPDHLEPVTHAENMRRGAIARLTAEDAAVIRASDDHYKDLATRFGVGPTTILAVRSGQNWRAEP